MGHDEIDLSMESNGNMLNLEMLKYWEVYLNLIFFTSQTETIFLKYSVIVKHFKILGSGFLKNLVMGTIFTLLSSCLLEKPKLLMFYE